MLVFIREVRLDILTDINEDSDNDWMVMEGVQSNNQKCQSFRDRLYQNTK